MGLKDKVRRLEQLAKGRLVSVEFEDRSVVRFGPEAIVDCRVLLKRHATD